MNASTKPLPSLSYGAKSTSAFASVAASRAIVLAFGSGLSVPDLPPAYSASVRGSRYGPTTSPVERQQSVRDLGVVLADAAGRNLAGREKQIPEVIGRRASSARR